MLNIKKTVSYMKSLDNDKLVKYYEKVKNWETRLDFFEIFRLELLEETKSHLNSRSLF